MSSIQKAKEFLASVLPEMDWEHDEHLADTPKRMVKALQELTSSEPFNFTTFESTSDEMVVVQDIPFYTFCAHHVLPFFGKAHIAYIPQGKICGLSKLARTVDMFSRTLNVQEELTNSIANYLELELEPLGVGVIMQAEHLCMSMRGIKTSGSLTTTSSMRGVFLDPSRGARSEFLHLIKS